MKIEQERFAGALLGLAVGGALGTTVEFRSPGSFAPVTEMAGGGLELPVMGQEIEAVAGGLCGMAGGANG